jgi:hypothetical protein
VSAHTRARIVKILLIVLAIVNGISMLVTALTLLFPPLTDGDAAESNLGGFLMALIGLGVALVTFAVYVATVVVFCMWLYRSANNVMAFGTPRSLINYSAGWTVGSFFVPIANLVIPYRATKEVWQNSQPGTATFLQAGSPPAWFPIWWTFWLLSNFASNVYFRLTWNDKVDREVGAVLGVAADSLTIVAAILAIVIVGEIDKRQEEASRSLGLETVGGPPMPPAFEPGSTSSL